MMSENYKEFLEEKFRMFYDLEYKYKIGGLEFDFLARFNQRSSKYIGSKKIEFYAFKNNEYFLYKKIYSEFNKDYLESIKSILDNYVEEITEIDNEHMSSVVTFIFEIDKDLDEETVLEIEKFKYYKSFMFGLKGWINCGLMVINPLSNKGFSNKFSKKELDKFLIKEGGN